MSRTRTEIFVRRALPLGLRFALGARPDRIRWMVLRQVAVMAMVGIGLGTLAAWGLGLAARNLVFGVEPGSPLSLVSAAALLVAEPHQLETMQR